MGQECTLFILVSKVKVTMYWSRKTVCRIIVSLYTYHHKTSFTDSTLNDVPYWFGVKGQGHNALSSKNGNWHIISFSLIIIELHMQTAHNLRNYPIDFGVQKSRLLSWITENCHRHISAFLLHLQSWNSTQRLPTSRGYACMVMW